MKYITINILCALMFIAKSLSSYGQPIGDVKIKRTILPFSYSSQQPLVSKGWKDVQLMVINKDQLFHSIQNNGKELSMVVIVTSGCGGTPSSIKYIKEVEEKYGDKAATYLLFSDSYKATDDVRRAVFNYKYHKQVYIVDHAYGETEDDREKGTSFRNSFCSECKKDIIGVPYNLVFDRQLHVLLHGYPNFKGPLQDVPSDYIGWLLRKRERNNVSGN